MGRFLVMLLRIFIIIMILALGTYYVVYFYSDSLVFLIDFGRQHPIKVETQHVVTQATEHKGTQTIDILEIPKPVEEVIPKTNPRVISQRDQSYALCSKAFIAFHSITVKFLENQSCHNEIVYLKSFGLSEMVAVILDEIDVLCQVTEDLIQDKILSKMLQIKKVSAEPRRKAKFLARMDKLQVYFYSEDFIKLCKQ